MMPLHAKFPLKTEPSPAIATALYHVTLENLPLTLKLPLAAASARPGTRNAGAFILKGGDRAFALAAQGEHAAARASLGDVDAFRTRVQTENSQWSILAEMEALLGNTDDAVRCAQAAFQQPSQFGAITRASREATLALVYAWTGQKGKAIAEYKRLLLVPYSGLNVHEMRGDPRFAPLRGDLRFEALLNDPKNNAPLF